MTTLPAAVTRGVVAVALLAASVGGTAAQAAPKGKAKAWKQMYELQMSGVMSAIESPTSRDCLAAPAGAYRWAHRVALTHPGTLSARLSGYTGSWLIAIYDANGKEIQRGGGTAFANGANTVYASHHAYDSLPPRYEVRACLYAGLSHALVTLAYTPE